MESLSPREYLFRMLRCLVGPLPHRGTFRTTDDPDEEIGGFAPTYTAAQDSSLWEKVDDLLEDDRFTLKLAVNCDAFGETAILMYVDCIQQDDGMIVHYRNASHGHIAISFVTEGEVVRGPPPTRFRVDHFCDFLTDALSPKGEEVDDLVPLGDTFQIINDHHGGDGGMVRIVTTRDPDDDDTGADNILPAELIELCITDIMTLDHREIEIQRSIFVGDDDTPRTTGKYRMWLFDDGAIVRPMITDVPSGRIMFIPN